MSHLPLLDETGHGTHGLFDGGFRIDAVLIVEIDMSHAETFQARIAGLADVLGLTVDPDEGTGGVADDPELGRENYAIAHAGEHAPHQPFIRRRPVDIGRVPEENA